MGVDGNLGMEGDAKIQNGGLHMGL